MDIPLSHRSWKIGLCRYGQMLLAAASLFATVLVAGCAVVAGAAAGAATGYIAGSAAADP
ncbi:MAG: hypothetical protein ACREJO_06685 [Phycisphaerales bacterium]